MGTDWRVARRQAIAMMKLKGTLSNSPLKDFVNLDGDGRPWAPAEWMSKGYIKESDWLDIPEEDDTVLQEAVEAVERMSEVTDDSASFP